MNLECGERHSNSPFNALVGSTRVKCVSQTRKVVETFSVAAHRLGPHQLAQTHTDKPTHESTSSQVSASKAIPHPDAFPHT